MTFIAMNRFRVALGKEEEFEDHLARPPERSARHARLCRLPSLARGERRDGDPVRLAHRSGRSRSHFEDWTRSEAFRRAHSGAPRSAGLYLGPPQFEGFDAVAETTKAV